MVKIVSTLASEILDSRGNPTVFCKVVCENGDVGSAAVPSGASTGEHEAVELRDGDPKRYKGKGTLRACANINGPLQKVVVGLDVEDQKRLDRTLCEADGTENKSRYGANAILAISLAAARARAKVQKMALYRSLGTSTRLPVPMLNIINGGVHADSSLDFQEFMIHPKGFPSFHEALRGACEVFHTLKANLKKRGYSIAVGDEGGFAPNLRSHEEGLEMICGAIQEAGYKLRDEISICLDCAASELFDKESASYIEIKKKARGEPFKRRTAGEMIDYLTGLVETFPIDTIEDGLAENDWEGWQLLTQKLGGKLQLVGDDIFVTNPKFLERGIREKVANSILIKVNQIGTLSETLDTMEMARQAGYKTVISHRSGETEDTFIADLAVATGAGQIKTGAPSRSDRVAKYNRLLLIEEELGKSAQFYV
jgi:enolase